MRQPFLNSVVATFVVLAGCNSAVPPTAPDAKMVESGAPQPPANSGVVGRWVGVGHKAQGSVRFSVQNGVARIDFSDDFAVGAVPGPYIYVNTTNNANTGNPLRVSVLRGNSGAQSYVFQIPPGAAYTWLLIWCDPFNVPVAEAQIPPTP